MPDVLSVSGGTEVCVSIVESVVIDVVEKAAGRSFYEKIVHLDVLFGSVFAGGEGVYGVIGVWCFQGVPFVFCEAVEIIGVNDCEFALSERNSSEGVAVADAAI